mgnify:CR=1 FL=1
MIKVLIVDDEFRVCQLICNLIDWGSLDMQIIGVAHNGIEARELARETVPDLVITDIRMPGCTGLELVEQLREIYRSVSFIIISGYTNFEYLLPESDSCQVHGWHLPLDHLRNDNLYQVRLHLR